MRKEFDTGLVWLRRDLRPHDNAALSAALQSCKQVHCAFVFDRAILDTLPGPIAGWNSSVSHWLRWMSSYANWPAKRRPD